MIKTQKLNDCGVCALANKMAISWNGAAFRLFGGLFSFRRAYNTKTRDLCQMLFPFNIEAGLIRVKAWADVPDGSIVKVIPPQCEGTGNWHWVVWKNGKIWDSCHQRPVNPKRTSYDCRLVSYIGRLRR